MSYQALARRWRPRHFKDVVGQEHVVSALTSALDNERVHHAFLFSGTRGVGKTTLARLLAKALNCQEGPTPSPCGECVSCREITQANSIDVIEIDAASNTGVDNMRDLRESARYGTARDRFKIFGQIQALTGEGRLSGIVLLVLPPGLFVAMYRLNPEYSQTLFTDPMGTATLAIF